MTNPSEKHSGSSSLPFAFGILFGVAATYLFGTEEGRKIVNKVLSSIPESARHPAMPIMPTEETAHHATYDFEAPPPPAPAVRPTRPEPFKPSK